MFGSKCSVPHQFRTDGSILRLRYRGRCHGSSVMPNRRKRGAFFYFYFLRLLVRCSCVSVGSALVRKGWKCEEAGEHMLAGPARVQVQVQALVQVQVQA